MDPVNRRQFVSGVAAAAGTIVLPSVGVASQSTRRFLRESGKRGEWPLVIGLLSTTNALLHENAIERLRRRHEFPRPLRYTSTDRTKAGFGTALIDYYIGAADLVFTALIVTDPRGRWATTKDKDGLYAAAYRDLIACGSPQMAIAMRHRNNDRRDRLLQQFLTNDLGIATVPAEQSNLDELAGFLSGCVYGDRTGVTNEVKRSLSDRLMSQARAVSFSVKTINI